MVITSANHTDHLQPLTNKITFLCACNGKLSIPIIKTSELYTLTSKPRLFTRGFHFVSEMSLVQRCPCGVGGHGIRFI